MIYWPITGFHLYRAGRVILFTALIMLRHIISIIAECQRLPSRRRDARRRRSLFDFDDAT